MKLIPRSVGISNVTTDLQKIGLEQAEICYFLLPAVSTSYSDEMIQTSTESLWKKCVFLFGVIFHFPQIAACTENLKGLRVE